MKVKNKTLNTKLSAEYTLLDIKEVLAATRYKSATTIDQQMRKGKFPFPVQPDRKRYWIKSEIEAWIDEQKAKRHEKGLKPRVL